MSRCYITSRKEPKGELAVTPKDEGYGIMISAFQGHKFGFGMKLTSEELHLVST
jgi:hypothetical protein